jgi:GTP-binding protein HflX
VIEADLLLHVVDSSLPNMDEQIRAVEEVLTEIDAADVPAIMVFNKVDCPHSSTIRYAFQRRYRGSVAVSAKTGNGLDELRAAILREAQAQIQELTVRVPIADGGAAAFLRRRTRIHDEQYDENYAIFTIEADAELLNELNEHPVIETVSAEPDSPTFDY